MNPSKKELGMRKNIIALKQRRPQAQHPGLILQRYLACAATGEGRDPDERRALLDAAIGAATSDSLRAVYSEAYDRSNSSFSNDVAATVELVTPGRLIVGLGSENVLETGIRLHHTYGLPFLPGSALKGLAAHYCQEVWGQRHNESAAESNRLFRRGARYHNLLFGTTDDSGVITFHDAWLTPPSLRAGALRLDVMTPHHPKWQNNQAPPTDFDSPIPVSFLSVAGAFQIRLSWRGPIETPQDEARAWTNLASRLLQEALAEWGVGGKTSSGYGRLIAVEESPQATSQPLHYAVNNPVTAAQPARPVLPKADDWVEAELLPEKTKKGGWRAIHLATRIAGPIQNSGDVPADVQPGQRINLIVKFANSKEFGFRYPTAADENKRNSPPSARPPKGGGHGRR